MLTTIFQAILYFCIITSSDVCVCVGLLHTRDERFNVQKKRKKMCMVIADGLKENPQFKF